MGGRRFLIPAFRRRCLPLQDSIPRTPRRRPSKHPLSSESTVKMQVLTNEPFILPPRYRMPGLYGQVTELCRQAGFTPKAVQKEVWLMQTIVGLVAGEIGVALVPASLRNLHRKGVVYREVQD